MTDQSPITPSPELIAKWVRTAPHPSNEHEHYYYVTTHAAQWGADQELEACCLWLNGGSKIDYDTAALLRAARRPKPPSLKEKALEELNLTADPNGAELSRTQVELIRRALEQLDD